MVRRNSYLIFARAVGYGRWLFASSCQPGGGVWVAGGGTQVIKEGNSCQPLVYSRCMEIVSLSHGWCRRPVCPILKCGCINARGQRWRPQSGSTVNAFLWWEILISKSQVCLMRRDGGRERERESENVCVCGCDLSQLRDLTASTTNPREAGEEQQPSFSQADTSTLLTLFPSLLWLKTGRRLYQWLICFWKGKSIKRGKIRPSAAFGPLIDTLDDIWEIYLDDTIRQWPLHPV